MNVFEKYNIPAGDIFKIATINFLNNPKEYSERVSLLVGELKSLNPMIISFQEVMENHREELEIVLAELGYIHHVYSDVRVASHKVASGNAIFSKIPFDKTTEFTVKPNSLRDNAQDLPILAASFDHNGHELHILVGHFAFGGNAEYNRLQQALSATRYAENTRLVNPKSIIILNGDLNATPNTDSMRFLKGEHIFNETSTLWIDSFSFVGDSEDWITSPADTHWAIQTAVGKNNPNLLGFGLNRRIDYVYVYEWAYGRAGTPLSYKTWGQKRDDKPYGISDHNGIVVEILLPQ